MDSSAVQQRLMFLASDGRNLDLSYQMTERGTLESAEPEWKFRTFATSALAEIERLVGKDSSYYTAIPQGPLSQQLAVVGYSNTFVPAAVGSLDSLREAVANGLLLKLETAHRQAVHSDFLQQARQLLDESYHVAAMVLIGGVLEEHLLKLCESRKLTWGGQGSLSKYITTLFGANVFDKTALNRLQAVMQSRNNAAHGKGALVKSDDAEDHWRYVQRFLEEVPT